MGHARVFVVVTESLADAERWLADLDALLGAGSAALYPPREGFGEVEPHLEVAGERVETLERLARGEVRALVTTARAVLERTRLPSAVRSARLELRAGERRTAWNRSSAHLARRRLRADRRWWRKSRSSPSAAASWTSTASAWPSRCALEF